MAIPPPVPARLSPRDLLLVLAVWGMATRRFGKVLTLLMWGPGWLIFAVVAAPWFMAVQSRFPEFGHYFFIVQHVERFASAGFNNAQPWWFYSLVLLSLTLPWSPPAIGRSATPPILTVTAKLTFCFATPTAT